MQRPQRDCFLCHQRLERRVDYELRKRIFETLFHRCPACGNEIPQKDWDIPRWRFKVYIYILNQFIKAGDYFLGFNKFRINDSRGSNYKSQTHKEAFHNNSKFNHNTEPVGSYQKSNSSKRTRNMS